MNSFTFHFSYMVSIQCTFLHGFKNVRQIVSIYCLHLTEFSLEWVLSQEYERKFPNFSHLHDVRHLAFLKCHGTKAFQYSLRSVCYEFFHAFEHNRNCWRLYHIFFAFNGVLYSMNSSLYLERTETTESSPTFLTFIGLLSIMIDLMVLNRTGTIEGFKAFL